MKVNIFFILLFILLSTLLKAQTYSEDEWTKYYVPTENKILGIWPHNSRFSDLARMKELRFKWGFNNILIPRIYKMAAYELVIEAGFDSSNIVRGIKLDSYQVDVESIPKMSMYYIDEPADEGDNLTVWTSVTEWIKSGNSSAQIILSGYKRNNQLRDFVNSIGDKVMFSSYKHWWELFGLWVSWPEDPDQRSDWSDMRNRFGSKFSLSWVGAHKDISEYDDLLGKAKNLGLEGVFLYQLEPIDNEVGDDNLETFSEAATKHGFLSTYFQQIRKYYENGILVEKKLLGPVYSTAIPSEFDHSSMIFENYTVTNNRIEDYFAEINITAGDQHEFIIPSNKKSSFNSNNEIILRPGFHAQTGSEFRASIGGD